MQKIVRISNFLNAVSELTGKTVSLLLIPMCLLLVYEVIARYGFNNPTIFSHELSTFLFGGIGVLGGAYAHYHKAHVNLDIFYGRWSPRTRAIMDIISSPLFFFFLVILIWRGAEMAHDSLVLNEHTSTPWGPPLFPLKLTIPLASILLLFQGIAKLCMDILFVIHGKE
ncbi:MAG: TRAP transporter small permease subunit [Nanoarchaeota archaeon]|nr:TRAP transporter small permease subunit [Nanoarchaeota archaeon]